MYSRTISRLSALLVTAVSCIASIGCSNDAPIVAESETVTLCLSAELPDNSVTRAAIDGDGAAASADQCRLQIYMHQLSGDPIKVYDKTKSVADLKATFSDISLIKSQTYDFLFWADNAAGAYYNTDNLKAVSMNGTYVGNNDARDAFFAALNDQTVTGPINKTVTLSRPFAQLNIITTDIPTVNAQLPSNVLLSSVTPSKVKVSYKAPSKFNVQTGVASDSVSFVNEASVYTTTWKTSDGAKNTLSMDYIFASTEKSVNRIEFEEINSALTDITATFDNIPLQRNYRTNIMGSLITNVAVFTVVIDPVWNSADYDYNAE